MRLAGMIPPAVSPLTPERTLDEAGVDRLVDRLLSGGASGIFVLGSCGEGPTLDRTVALDLVNAFVRAVDGRVPILAGVGETSTERAVAVARTFEDAGVDALVVMAPMYFNDKPAGAVERHFHGVAARTSSPIVAYNIPHLTHRPITPRALANVAEIDSVVALKESSGDWNVFTELMAVAHDRGLQVFQGAEKLIARSLAAGADGAVPGIANVVPDLASRLVQAGLSGETPVAEALQSELDEICAIQSTGFWLSALKGMMDELGIIGPTLGEALPALTDSERSDLRRSMVALDRWGTQLGESGHEIGSAA